MKLVHQYLDYAESLFAASFAFTASYGLLSLDFGKHSWTLYIYKNR